MENDPHQAQWWNATEPFEFGISTEGELLISWALGNMPPGMGMRFGVKIPASELPRLRLGLEQSRGIQETLAAVPPTRSKH